MPTRMNFERESCRLRMKLMIEKREFEPPLRGVNPIFEICSQQSVPSFGQKAVINREVPRLEYPPPCRSGNFPLWSK